MPDDMDLAAVLQSYGPKGYDPYSYGTCLAAVLYNYGPYGYGPHGYGPYSYDT